jgi:hypothetical protein
LRAYILQTFKEAVVFCLKNNRGKLRGTLRAARAIDTVFIVVLLYPGNEEKSSEMTHQGVFCSLKLRESGLVARVSRTIQLVARWRNVEQLEASCPAFQWGV